MTDRGKKQTTEELARSLAYFNNVGNNGLLREQAARSSRAFNRTRPHSLWGPNGAASRLRSVDNTEADESSSNGRKIEHSSQVEFQTNDFEFEPEFNDDLAPRFPGGQLPPPPPHDTSSDSDLEDPLLATADVDCANLPTELPPWELKKLRSSEELKRPVEISMPRAVRISSHSYPSRRSTRIEGKIVNPKVRKSFRSSDQFNEDVLSRGQSQVSQSQNPVLRSGKSQPSVPRWSESTKKGGKLELGEQMSSFMQMPIPGDRESGEFNFEAAASGSFSCGQLTPASRQPPNPGAKTSKKNGFSTHFRKIFNKKKGKLTTIENDSPLRLHDYDAYQNPNALSKNRTVKHAGNKQDI